MQPEVVTRHVTEYNIKAAKFSAYEEDHLVTCGRDNVRMYRLKNGALRGVTVRTGAPDKRVGWGRARGGGPQGSAGSCRAVSKGGGYRGLPFILPAAIQKSTIVHL
jgi:hypothetical protein